MPTIDEQVATMRSLTESHDWADMNDEVSRLIEAVEHHADHEDYRVFNRELLLERFPMVTAVIIDYSGFYHSEHGAPFVLWAYIRRTHAASEWHFHMASVGKISLDDANDTMVWKAVECAYYSRQLFKGDSPGFLKGMEWVERGKQEFARKR